MTQQSITITLAGQPLKLRTDHDPAYLLLLTQHIDNILRELQRPLSSPPRPPSPQVLLLALLRIADELFQARSNTENLKEAMQVKTESIIRLLDGASSPSP